MSLVGPFRVGTHRESARFGMNGLRHQAYRKVMNYASYGGAEALHCQVARERERQTQTRTQTQTQTQMQTQTLTLTQTLKLTGTAQTQIDRQRSSAFPRGGLWVSRSARTVKGKVRFRHRLARVAADQRHTQQGYGAFTAACEEEQRVTARGQF